MSTEKEQMRGRGIRTLEVIPFLLCAHVPGDVAKESEEMGLRYTVESLTYFGVIHRSLHDDADVVFTDC